MVQQFTECLVRMKAALVACPHSLVLRLLFAQVLCDNPGDVNNLSALRATCAPASRPATTSLHKLRMDNGRLVLARAVVLPHPHQYVHVPVFSGAAQVTTHTGTLVHLQELKGPSNCRSPPPQASDPSSLRDI